MPPPNVPEKNRRPYWLSADAKGKVVISYTAPAGKNTWEFGPFNSGDQTAVPPDGEEITYTNGEVWDAPADGSEPAPLNDTAKQGARIRTNQEYQTPPSPTSQWSIQTKADGSKVRVNELTGETAPLEGFDAKPAQAKRDQWQDPQDGSQWIIDSDTGSKVKQISGPIPGWQPGLGVRWPQQAPQRAPRYPDEERLAQLNIQKAERSLQDPFTLYQDEMERAIDSIAKQRAAGKISAAEADRLMMLAKQNGEAALRGTTPWQMQQQTEDTARDTLNTSLSAKTNMSQGLLSGLGGIYGKILQSSNPPLNFDPMAMASSAVDTWGYGPEADAKARDIVRGLLSGSRGF